MARLALGILALATLASPTGAGAAPVVTSFAYRLATSTGVVPFSGAQLSYDRVHRELYVLGGGPVRVFNEAGMEIYSFGENPEVGTIAAVGVLEGGDLVSLSILDKGPTLLHLDFRGEVLGVIEPRGVPEEHRDFVPNAMKVAKDRIYLANLGEMTFMVLGVDGSFVGFFDTFPMMEIDEDKRATTKREDLGIRSFDVDRAGNILFVVQPLFKACVLSPSGALKSWGVAGSAPGKFNVLSAITADDRGNYYVSDVLKSAVIVFDEKLNFVREFGYRGSRPHNLVSPVDVAAGSDRLFVSQYGRRGVSVFKLEYGPDDGDRGPRGRRADAR